MTRAWLLVALLACARLPAEPAAAPALPRTVRLLPPPPVLDLDSPSAVYRTAVALHLQPAWAQFLEDCRLRLPAAHPLNVMSLAATAEIAIDTAGHIVDVQLASSGDADFDEAVRQVIGDAMPLPRPPRALWSDDDRVYLRWLFARDRRQAGPATASVVARDLPVAEVVARLVGAGDLVRAARRVAREPDGTARRAATHRLMIAALSEGLASSDAVVRRSAVDAIGRARAGELAPAVRELLTATSDLELRVAAMRAVAQLGDRASAPILVDQLRLDVHDSERLARAEVDALVALGAPAEAAAVLADTLVRGATPNVIALYALSGLSVPEIDRRPTVWLRAGDARVRAGACHALASAASSIAWSGILRGLRDRAATVRASCLEATAARGAVASDRRGVLARVRELTRDRDATVRARAVAALASLEPGAPLPDLAGDRAAEVRAAYARVLARVRGGDAPDRLRALVDDRDPDVRAAAWTSLRTLGGPSAEIGALAARAATDPAPQVRAAVAPILDDDALALRLATSDAAGDVRTAALVAVVARRGRAASTDLLLDRLAAAPAGSAERVRAALAWLLAR